MLRAVELLVEVRSLLADLVDLPLVPRGYDLLKKRRRDPR